MKNEEKFAADSVTDIRTRIKNLLWTVSGNYELDIEVNPDEFRKSKYIAFYEAVRQGSFEKYFDVDEFESYVTKKVYAGAEPSVLLSLARLCIDSAVWKKIARERAGVESIRQKAFRDTLEKDNMRLTHTDWGYIESCYLKFVLDGTKAEERVQKILDKIISIEESRSTSEILRCLDEIYREAYEKGFTKKFKGLTQELKDSDGDMKEYEDKDFLDEEDEESDKEHLVSLFTDSLFQEDEELKYRSHGVRLDEESASRMEEYIERNYGKTYLTYQEQRYYSSQICKGIHEKRHLHFTDGILHCGMKESAMTEFVESVKAQNLEHMEKRQLVTRQNIQALSDMLRRALLSRNEKEVCASEYGTIRPDKLWNLERTSNRKLFERELIRDNSDFAVEVLMDASGSQQGRQGMVALQGYMISEALSVVRIPHRVMGFCTFGAYTVMHRFRDYEDDRAMNGRIFEFYGSANNRDGLAIQAAADSLINRQEENKILIVLSDGKPNDIVAGEDKEELYCMEFAVKDTATEVRKLRNKGISVLGVFAGEEEDLQAEKKIFGRDFAYIRDIENFANVVGRYLRRQLLE